MAGNSSPSVEDGLKRLQAALRRRPPSDQVAVSAVAVADSPAPLNAAQARLVEELQRLLLDDLRFEHLRSEVPKVVAGFVHNCSDRPKENHVSAFIETHAQTPRTSTCYLPVEYLRVSKELVVLGVRLIPPDDAAAPPPLGRFSLEPPVGSLAVVDVIGTDYVRMVQRARNRAEHTLRVLRVALHVHPDLHDRQLRFRLSEAFSWGGSGAGFSTRSDSPYELGLDDGLLHLAGSQSVAHIPIEPLDDIDRHVDLAMRWIERAIFTGEELVALLFLFFGLEALLGRKSDGLKGHELAVRQMVLSQALDQGFTHPTGTFLLYDRVRSAAVHGEDAPWVDASTVSSFAWVVRRTLDQFLTLAKRESFRKRAQVLTYLDDHPSREGCLQWLRGSGGDDWKGYLAKLPDAP